MEEFQRGDVVFARFIFTDVSQTKNRPAVIIAALPNDDFILCPVTSRRRQNDPFQIELKKDEILGRKLPHDSFIRPNLLMTVHRSLILWKQGTLAPEKLKRVTEVIVHIVTGSK